METLCEQADLGGANRELAAAGPEHRTLHSDDVADVPLLELGVDALRQLVAAQEKLDAPRDVPEVGERGLAHHPARHEPARDSDPGRQPAELFRLDPAVAILELSRFRIPPKVVGVGSAPVPKLPELFPALPDLLALLLRHRSYTPAFRLASMNRSRSPSRTACVLPISMPVRRSFIRD